MEFTFFFDGQFKMNKKKRRACVSDRPLSPQPHTTAQIVIKYMEYHLLFESVLSTMLC